MEYNNNNNNLGKNFINYLIIFFLKDNKYQNIIYIVRHGLREDWLNQKVKI